MFWRRNRNKCGHWDCERRIPDDDFLCEEHHEKWAEGFIDRCPKCSRFKDVMYQLCLDCYFGRPVKPWKPTVEIPAPKKTPKVELSDIWVDGHMRPDRFFIYILELDDGVLYVGHTTDLREQLAEQKEQKMSSTAGRSPRLQYLQLVATKEVAEEREVELKRLIESNPGQIHLMITDFTGRMRDLGYKEYF